MHISLYEQKSFFVFCLQRQLHWAVIVATVYFIHINKANENWSLWDAFRSVCFNCMGIGHVHQFWKTNGTRKREREAQRKMPTKNKKHTSAAYKHISNKTLSLQVLLCLDVFSRRVCVLFRLNKTISEQFLISKQIFNYRKSREKK